MTFPYVVFRFNHFVFLAFNLKFLISLLCAKHVEKGTLKASCLNKIFGSIKSLDVGFYILLQVTICLDYASFNYRIVFLYNIYIVRIR